MSERKFHPTVKAFDGAWFGVPAFFTEDLMRCGKGIPASFWKLTFVLWRDILKPSPDPNNAGQFLYHYTAKTTFEQLKEDHRIGDKAVQSWQGAYFVSGLFSVKKGRRKAPKLPGEPTIWRYNPAATKQDWLAFIIALSRVVSPANEARRARHGTDENGMSCLAAFQLRLAIEVDKVRAAVNGTAGPGLPPVNEKRIEFLLEEGVGTRNPDGTITVYDAPPKWNGLQEPQYQEQE